MCKKIQFKYCPSKIDPCMKNLIEFINEVGYETLACCCGHRKYNMSIIIKDINGRIFDLISGVDMLRKKKFYKKDKQGYYYIPEIIEK